MSLNSNLNLKMKISFNLNLILKPNLNLGSARYSTSGKLTLLLFKCLRRVPCPQAGRLPQWPYLHKRTVDVFWLYWPKGWFYQGLKQSRCAGIWRSCRPRSRCWPWWLPPCHDMEERRVGRFLRILNLLINPHPTPTLPPTPPPPFTWLFCQHNLSVSFNIYFWSALDNS